MVCPAPDRRTAGELPGPRGETIHFIPLGCGGLQEMQLLDGRTSTMNDSHMHHTQFQSHMAHFEQVLA